MCLLSKFSGALLRILSQLFSDIFNEFFVFTDLSGMLLTFGKQLPVFLNLFAALYTPERLTVPFNTLKILAVDSPL